MTPNERNIRAFAEQFTPPLPVFKTERVNSVAVPDAWTVSYWDAERGIGVTAAAYSGQLHAFLEASGRSEICEMAGCAIAKALDRWEPKPNGADNG